MRITCPACDAGYDVPDAMIGIGRSVRCARCMREWQPQPAAAEPAALPAQAEPAPAFGSEAFDAPEPDRPRFSAGLDAEPVLRSPDEDPGPRVMASAQGGRPGAAAAGRTDGWIGWLASAVLLAALTWAAVAFRDKVQDAWPPSGRAYAALGLARTGAAPAEAPAK